MSITLWFCVDCTQFAHGIDAHERGEDYPDAVVVAFNDPTRELGKPGILTVGTMEHDAQWCPRVDLDTGDILDADMGECGCEHIDFTWNRCDACLSSLGGSREAFTLWED